MFFATDFIPIKPISSCGDYTPYWAKNLQGERIVNPHRNNISRTLMDLKDPTNTKHQRAIKDFSRMLETTFSQRQLMTHFQGQSGVTIAIVPSSGENNVSQALIDIAANVARTFNKKGFSVTVEPMLFQRTKTIQKLHHGGDRSIHVHLNSIIVNTNDLIATDNIFSLRQRRIIIIDDVSTTGGSLRACYQLLEAQGITSANIELVSLLKTSTA